MAPGGGLKRKRGDRSYNQDGTGEGLRQPSYRSNSFATNQSHSYSQSVPNHPQETSHHGNYHDPPSRSLRRGSRGGRGTTWNPGDSSSTGHATPRSSDQGLPAVMVSPNLSQRQEKSKETEPMQYAKSRPLFSQNPDRVKPDGFTYQYDRFTEETRHTWSENGRQRFIEAGIQSRGSCDVLALGVIFQEILRAGLDGLVTAVDAGSVVQAILRSDPQRPAGSDTISQHTAASIFLNCLPFLSSEDMKSEAFRTIVLSTDISPTQMREELDMEILLQLKLVRGTFERKVIRNQTNILYRQSNYNLLREESEGYSKLVTELFTTSGNEFPSTEAVVGTFERVKAMIGTFDLDVGRVLDITLDVFAAVLVKHYRFFVKYLRISSWWPLGPEKLEESDRVSHFDNLPRWAIPETQERTILSDGEKASLAASRDRRDAEFWEAARRIGMKAFFELGGCQKSSTGDTAWNAQLQEFTEEGIAQRFSCGNKVAAQILGFKLRFYSSPSRDPADTLPPNLIYLAALLIKIGFISLGDLYPHLWPPDSDMESVKEQKMKEKAEKERLQRLGGGAMNALVTAGALPDDTVPQPPAARLKEGDDYRAMNRPEQKDQAPPADVPLDTRTAAEQQEELPEPADQKVQLLKSLLCIGALPEALFILGRFPWLPEAFPDIPEYLHRIFHHSLNKIYEPLQPLKYHSHIREPQRVVDSDQSGTLKGYILRTEQPARKILRWAQLDRVDTNEGIDYRFYWEDWADSVPVCQSVEDVFTLCNTILNYSGIKIGRDPALLVKLARIGNSSLVEDSSERNRARWADLLKRLLIPALSLTRHNSGTVSEVWNLLKQFSLPIRYNIYAEWYTGQISRASDLASAFDITKAETKDVLKRLSSTNKKEMARALAKVASSSPGMVFLVAIKQIESYENMIDVIVDCSRYFTDLGYDILTWALINSLGVRGRDRVQADGMLTSRWLSALSSFTGRVLKRYSIMNPTPILQYVIDQLRKGNPTDLVVLEHVISSMAGIVSDTNFNESQVIGMAGGSSLQSQIMLLLKDQRHEPGMPSSTKRLIKSIAGSRLAGQLLVLLAQQRQVCIYQIPEHHAHLKLLGNLFDQIHTILTQYLELLRSSLSIRDFNGLVADVPTLIGDYGIDPSVAFWIGRPSISADIADFDTKATQRRSGLSIDENKEDVVSNQSSSNLPNDAMEVEQDAAAIAAEVSKREEAQAEEPSKFSNTLEPSPETSPQSNEHAGEVEVSQPRPHFPWHPVLRSLASSLRTRLPRETFEVLSDAFYVTFWQLGLGDMLVPTSTYEEQVNQAKKKLLAVSGDHSLPARYKEQAKKSLTDLQDHLRAELKEQVSAYSQTRARLQKEKDLWFEGCNGKTDELSNAILELCFLPRVLLSPVDALYTFKILKLLHSTGAKNFRTVRVLDELFSRERMTSLFFLCTEKEANNLGRFFNELLKDLARWHADRAVFEREAYGPKKDLIGFRKNPTDPAFFDYEDFRKVLQKWHMGLNVALKNCFSGGEYMHIRNAITILSAVALTFPVINWMGHSLTGSLSELTKSEGREDLQVAAQTLLGKLKRREKEWILPQAFSLNKASNVSSSATRISQVNGSKASAEKGADTLQPIKNVETVKPAAAPQGRTEPEDGEINDHTAKISAQHEVKPSEQTNETPSIGDSGCQIEAEAKSSTGVEQRNTQSSGPLIKPEARIKLEGDKSESRLARSGPILPTDISGNSRLQHSLPSRPESHPPTPRHSEIVPADRSSGRSVRDPRYPEHRSHDRSGPMARELASDRHSLYRNAERLTERNSISERERQDTTGNNEKPRSSTVDNRFGNHPRDTRLPPRSDQRADRGKWERQYADANEGLRLSDVSMNRPKESLPPLSRPHSGHPERSSYPHGPVEPDRNYSGSYPERRAEMPRAENNSHSNSQRGSRATSPSRRDDRIPRVDHQTRADSYIADSRRSFEDNPARSRYDDTRHATKSHAEKPSEALNNVGPSHFTERSRENVRGSLTSHPDPNMPRSNMDSTRGQQQESQYGRLNSDTSIGPRPPTGAGAPVNRGPRKPNALVGGSNGPGSGSTESSGMYSTERAAPTGPSAGRPSRHNPPYSRPSAPNPIPSGGRQEIPDGGSVHPDRLKAIQTSATRTGFESNRGPVAPSGVGPVPKSRDSLQGTSPTTASPVGPGTGTQAFLNDRGRGDKRFAGLTKVLSPAGSPNGPDRPTQAPPTRARPPRTSNMSTSQSMIPPGRRDGTEGQEPYPLAVTTTATPSQDLFASRFANSGSGLPRQDSDGDLDRGGAKELDRGIGRRSAGRSLSPVRSSGRAGQVGPAYGTDDPRPPVRRGAPDYREYRVRGSGGGLPPPPLLPPLPPPLAAGEGDGRRGTRDDVGAIGKEREWREADRRDDWVAERTMHEARDHDRRDAGTQFMSAGRKRPRAPEDAFDQARRIRRV